MMRIDRTTAPGSGTLHHLVTRDGGRFCVLIDSSDNRHLYTYGASDPDQPAQDIVMEPDEADQLAELLHSHPMADRLLSLERRVDALIGERGP